MNGLHWQSSTPHRQHALSRVLNSKSGILSSCNGNGKCHPPNSGASREVVSGASNQRRRARESDLPAQAARLRCQATDVRVRHGVHPEARVQRGLGAPRAVLLELSGQKVRGVRLGRYPMTNLGLAVEKRWPVSAMKRCPHRGHASRIAHYKKRRPIVARVLPTVVVSHWRHIAVSHRDSLE
jgi:hypothetical protein